VNVIVCLITAVAAYLLGSIPTGYLVGRAKGIDVRKVGSGNIGATNAFRILGKGPGIFVLVADGLKGWVAVAWIPELAHRFFDSTTEWDVHTLQWLKIIASISVILGHNYTCWLKFKGGKGIATSAGVLAALVPVAMIVSLSTWIIVCVLTRYVSLASIAASLILPFATWIVPRYGWNLVLITALMAALAIYKHKGNISRLLNGTESRLGHKKIPPPTGATL
jgi:acyl phosphate:glycerol-3-phosphate acyltransferase